VTPQARELAIQPIFSRAVVSTEIVDILAASGIKSPDISILSDEFLAEVQQMEKKNLALLALQKLLNDGIRSRAKANVVQTKACFKLGASCATPPAGGVPTGMRCGSSSKPLSHSSARAAP
jgi:type I site-specific restriction-modification system R (restriction) subunit